MNALNYTTINEQIENYRHECEAKVHKHFQCLISWAISTDETKLHTAEDSLWEQLMLFGQSLVLLWLAYRIPTTALLILTRGKGKYSFVGFSKEVVRSRFGVIHPLRRSYKRISGTGPTYLSPDDRNNGLVAGRMSRGAQKTL